MVIACTYTTPFSSKFYILHIHSLYSCIVPQYSTATKQLSHYARHILHCFSLMSFMQCIDIVRTLYIYVESQSYGTLFILLYMFHILFSSLSTNVPLMPVPITGMSALSYVLNSWYGIGAWAPTPLPLKTPPPPHLGFSPVSGAWYLSVSLLSVLQWKF